MKFLFLFLLFAYSVDENKPDFFLKNYIEKRYEGSWTKDEILERVGGKVKEEIVAMSESELKEFLYMKKYKLSNIIIENQNCEIDKCAITYVMKYTTNDSEGKLASSEVKKVADLRKINGKWIIFDVADIKTYHELRPNN